MELVEINYLAVLVAALSAMVVGSIWYAKPIFGRIWMKSIGFGPEHESQMKKEAPKALSMMFLAALITSYVLAHFVYYVDATTVSTALQAGFWLWLGFLATTLFGAVLFEKRSYQWFFVAAGYRLVEICVMAVILALWQ